MVVQLADLGGDLPDLPPLESVLPVKYGAVLLLELPEARVDVKGAAEVALPLLVSILEWMELWRTLARHLRQVPQAVEQLLGLF